MAKLSSSSKGFPNWLEMPDELMANILGRLGTKERLKSALKVCPTWRIVCKNPEMWKVIGVHKTSNDWVTWNTDYQLVMLTKKAVDLSSGELLDISLSDFGTDNLLNHVVASSSKLKRLGLVCCSNITGSGLSTAIKRVPKLEELDLFLIALNEEDIEVIGRSCPQLKSFMYHKKYAKPSTNCDAHALAIANSMPELRHLELSDYEMTTHGLMAILNGCPRLESLDVRMCDDLYVDEELGKMCMERIKDFKFRLQVIDYGFDHNFSSDVDNCSEWDFYDYYDWLKL